MLSLCLVVVSHVTWLPPLESTVLYKCLHQVIKVIQGLFSCRRREIKGTKASSTLLLGCTLFTGAALLMLPGAVTSSLHTMEHCQRVSVCACAREDVHLFVSVVSAPCVQVMDFWKKRREGGYRAYRGRKEGHMNERQKVNLSGRGGCSASSLTQYTAMDGSDE